MEGSPLGELYDYRWFTAAAARHGYGDQLVGFAILPPPSAFVMVPLVPFGPENAAWLWTVAQVLLFWGVGVSAAREVGLPAWVGLACWFPVWPAVVAHLTNGQLHILAVAFFVGGVLAFGRGAEKTAGVLFALAVGLKIYAWPVFLWMALRGHGRVVIAGVLTIVLGGAVSVWALGPEVHRVFFLEIAPAGLDGRFTDPFSVHHASLVATLRRLFVFHPALNPQPVAALPSLAAFLATVTSLGALWVAVTARERDWRVAVGVCSITPLIFGAGLSRYHLVALVPVVLWAVRSGRRASLACAGLCVAVVWAPTLWWSPRLLLATALWGLIVCAAGMRPATPKFALPLVLAAGVVAAGRARSPDVYEQDHPALPLVAADLLVDSDGTLWFSGLPTRREVPGRGWVGYRWRPGEEPELVAWDPSHHVWSPRITEEGVVFGLGSEALPGPRMAGGWELSDRGAGVRALRPRPVE